MTERIVVGTVDALDEERHDEQRTADDAAGEGRFRLRVRLHGALAPSAR